MLITALLIVLGLAILLYLINHLAPFGASTKHALTALLCLIAALAILSAYHLLPRMS